VAETKLCGRVLEVNSAALVSHEVVLLTHGGGHRHHIDSCHVRKDVVNHVPATSTLNLPLNPFRFGPLESSDLLVLLIIVVASHQGRDQLTFPI